MARIKELKERKKMDGLLRFEPFKSYKPLIQIGALANLCMQT